MLWILYLINCLYVLLDFSPRFFFFLVLLFETNSFVCSFCSMKLGEVFTCPSFEEVSLRGSILILCACAWWYWISSEHKSHLSPGWVRHDALLSGQHHTNGDEGGSQVAGSETMRFESKLVLFTLSVSSSLAHLPKMEAVLEQEGTKWASCYVPRC